MMVDRDPLTAPKYFCKKCDRYYFIDPAGDIRYLTKEECTAWKLRDFKEYVDHICEHCAPFFYGYRRTEIEVD
jgi:hypothetical protein